MTEQQAIESARQFCDTLGSPVGSVTKVEGPALQIPPERADKPVYLRAYRMCPWWQLRYKIHFEPSSEVDVSISGKVVQYFCPQSEEANVKPFLQASLTRAEALNQAEQTLQAAGHCLREWRLRRMEAEIVVNTAEQAAANNTGRKDAFEAEWRVEFQRQFYNLPMRDHVNRVSIGVRCGEVRRFTVQLPSPDPESYRENVDLVSACQIARDHLHHVNLYRAALESARFWQNTEEEREAFARIKSDIALQAAVLYRVNQEVVQRNTLWVDLNGTPRADPARVAWICYFRVNGHKFEVFVDGETQEVIGGAWHIPIGKQNKAKMQLKPE